MLGLGPRRGEVGVWRREEMSRLGVVEEAR